MIKWLQHFGYFLLGVGYMFSIGVMLRAFEQLTLWGKWFKNR